MTLTESLERHGLMLSTLQRDGEALILFGSRSAGLARSDSDWDILVVGQGPDQLQRGLDIVYVEPEQFFSSRWRGGELASHVSHWGRTITGSPEWLEALTDVKVGPEAIAHKHKLLTAQLHALECFWPSLGPWTRTNRTRRIRRDLQRYARLVEGFAVPPTALLDREWSGRVQAESLGSLFANAGFSSRLTEELSSWVAAQPSADPISATIASAAAAGSSA